MLELRADRPHLGTSWRWAEVIWPGYTSLMNSVTVTTAAAER